jgi:hypothetical protein
MPLRNKSPDGASMRIVAAATLLRWALPAESRPTPRKENAMSSIVVVVFDRSLGIAQYAGEKRFATPSAWTQQYADAVATVLGRPAVRIDVADRVVG